MEYKIQNMLLFFLCPQAGWLALKSVCHHHKVTQPSFFLQAESHPAHLVFAMFDKWSAVEPKYRQIQKEGRFLFNDPPFRHLYYKSMIRFRALDL